MLGFSLLDLAFLGQQIPRFRSSDITYGFRSSDTSFYSPFEFTSLTPRDITNNASGIAWSGSSADLTYNEIIGHCNTMSVNNPTRVTYDSMTAMDGISVIPIVKIDDDGIRPVITIFQGVHGSERASSHGLIRFMYDYLDSNINTDPFFNDARNKFTVIVFPIVQPWGWQQNSRENSNGVDINRNCVYGWEYTVSSDKGTVANSEENGLIRNYLYSGSYYQRQIVSVDSHGWGYYGQWWIGYLVQQMWYTKNVAKAQRSHYLYLNHMLDKRLSSSFYTNNRLTIGLNGADGMRSVESRGSLKPYINNNGLEWTNPNCYRILVEHPQIFNGGSSATGSLGQSSSICSIIKYDTFYSALACASELNNMLSYSVGTFLDCPAMTPINSNSLFQSWNDTFARPDWTTYSKVNLTQSWDSASNMYYTRVIFPKYLACPNTMAEAGYLTMSYNGNPYIVIIGGSGNSGDYNPKSFIENLSNSSQSIISNVPVGKACAIATDGTNYIWRSGGYYNSQYINTIYRTTLDDVFSGTTLTWTSVGTMSNAVQRHTMHYWNDPTDNKTYLIVVGGRTSVGYTDKIYKYRVDDDSYTETTMSTVLSSSRGWHVSAISASSLFVFGGYNGVTTNNGIRKIDLVNDTYTSPSALPGTRKQMGIATDPNDPNSVYLVFGNTGTGLPTGSIYKYNLSTSTNAVVSYTFDSATEESSGSTEDYTRMSPACAVWDNTLYIYGGDNPNTSSQHDEVYELDIDSLIMSNRLSVSEASYGYLKISRHSSGHIFENTTVGDVFTAVVDIRRSSGSLFNGATDPYIRIVWKTGSDPYYSLRENISGKFVPTMDWSTVTFPIIITSSLETEIQAPYIRTYVKGEGYDIKGFQVFKGNLGKACRIVPQTGSTELTTSRVFGIPLMDGKTNEKIIRFEPFFGANSSMETDLINFTLNENRQVTNMVLHYSASVTSSRPTVTLDYAIWYDNTPKGEFKLQWKDNDGPHTQSFLQNCELNYASDRFEGYRRDNTSLKFITRNNTVGFTASMWFKGQMDTLYVTKSINMTGFTTNGVGMFLYD